MGSRPRHGLFITGTNTDVGKTYVASLLARWLTSQGCRVGVSKPVASGCRLEGDELVSDDALALWEAAGRPGSLEDVCPQRFQAPLAPHLAARVEGRAVDRRLLRSAVEVWTDHCDLVLVEGAGGLMSPISDDDYVADLAADLGYPLLIVAANALGVIHQTLQTIVVAAHHRPPLTVAGVVLNDVQHDTRADASHDSNYGELVRRCGVPVLAHVPYCGGEESVRHVDWRSLLAEA